MFTKNLDALVLCNRLASRELLNSVVNPGASAVTVSKLDAK